jgi:hypothetical protein|tara:strand:+ start:1288 stop:1497 length:210 start_codon:yes stop_codon:yes gene_type:complete
VGGCRAARAGLFVYLADARLGDHVGEFDSLWNCPTGDLTPGCCLLEQRYHSCSLDALIFAISGIGYCSN